MHPTNSLLALALVKAQQRQQEIVAEPLVALVDAVPMLGVQHTATLRRWIHSGFMRAQRVGPNGHYRVSLTEIQRIRKSQLQELPG